MNNDLEWSEEEPIGTALEDSTPTDDGVHECKVSLTPKFMAHMFHMRSHGFKPTDRREML